MLEEHDVDNVQECVSTHDNGIAYRKSWERIKKFITEALKPSHNNARDEICAYYGKDCGYMRFNGVCMGVECSLHPSRKTSPVA